jgi:hypothetical protein
MKFDVWFSEPLYEGAVTTRVNTRNPRTPYSFHSRVRVAVNLALGACQATHPLRNAHICVFPLRIADLEHFDGNSISGPDTYQSALLHRIPLKRDATFPDVVITLRSGQIEWWELK